MFAGFHGLVVPYAGLYFANVGTFHHQHAESGLTDTAADGEGQQIVQQHLVEGELAAGVRTGDGQLAVERLGIHADTHGGKLERATENVVPEEQVTVERPIVVVGGAVAVRLAGFQLAADLHDEHGLVLLGKFMLPSLGGQIGVEIFQLLRGDEGHLVAQLGAQLGVGVLQLLVDGADGVNDGAHGLLEILQRAVWAVDDLLPVPLVHVDGMNVVQILVAADGVHVGDKSLVHFEIVALEGETFPLGERMDHLRVGVDGGNVEGNGTLGAAQIVIQTGRAEDEEGR